jgi:hypothetical protein
MLMFIVAGKSMKSPEKWLKSGQYGHPLLHRQLALGIYQASGTAHIKLTRLSMLVNFCKVWVLKHE